MIKTLKLIPEETSVDFIRLRYLGFIISFIMMAGSIGVLATKGLNFGVDFTGGAVIEARLDPVPDISALRAKLNDAGVGSVSLQEFGAPSDMLIRLPQQDGGEEAQKASEDKIKAALEEFQGEAGTVDYRRVEFVGPQVGKELVEAGTYAVIFSILGIMAYVWFRFEWQFSVGTVATLIHDALIMLGFFAIANIEFNLATLAAVLMITGYSVNDTVVVYDFVRDTMRKFRKMELSELLNLSINRTLSRTILTSVSTLLALGALWFFGGEVIQDFVDALVIGILLGTYSSIFIATPVLLFLNPRENISED